jgi:phospholipid transport system substrate-binding protein
MTRKAFLLLSAALFSMALAVPARADASAEAFVRAKQTELASLLKKGKAADKQLEAVFDEMLDYETLAKESLGVHWDERTAEEKKEFSTVLQRLVKNAYRKNLKKTLDYEVTFKGETKANKGVLVRTVARNKKNERDEPVSIDYLLHKPDGKWRVFDIVTEGSSLISNYRNPFRRVIKDKGFAELMRRMKRKAEKEEA